MEGFVAGYGRVLGQHRYEIANAGLASEAGEPGHAGVPLRRVSGTTMERRPMRTSPCGWRAWSRLIVVCGLLLDNIEQALRDQHGTSFQAIGAGETHTPAL